MKTFKRSAVFIITCIFLYSSFSSYASSISDNCDAASAKSNDAIEAGSEHSVEVEPEESHRQRSGKNPDMEYCRHGIACEFDDATMTLTNAYKGNRVQDVIWDVEYWVENHYAVVLYDSQEVTEGELQVGMVIQIYHGDELYGEYTIGQLLPIENSNKISAEQTGPIKAKAANAYGFILPIDNMNLTSNISCEFGIGNPPHRGIDIRWPGIEGETIRAAKSGTVSFIQTWDGVTTSGTSNQTWGHCIKIKHQDGTSTLYAHMQESPAPNFKNGDSITQGQPIGTVGSTGYSTAPHLHLEVYQGIQLVNPITYLTGAPTYSGAHTCTYEYVWFEGAHPHERYEQCTICGDLRSMGTYAAAYAYTYYLTDHPHRQYGMCTYCNIEKFTGEHKTCNQIAIYPDGDHPHRRYRKYACGANEYLDSYGECNQVAIYPDGDHPHRRYRVYACGATEYLDSYGECNQVAIYADGDHPHRRYRVYACGATEWLDSYGECTCK